MSPDKELDSFLLIFLRVFSLILFFLISLIDILQLLYFDEAFVPIGFSDAFILVSSILIFLFTVAAEHLLNLMELLKWK